MSQTQATKMMAESHKTGLPNFIGIGAPKAGTTWLARCLSEHPDVYMPPAKELVFFDYRDVEAKLGDYLAHFAGVKEERAIGEFTTRYFASERPAPRIKEMIPHAKFLICLRNPVDQIYSHYWHLSRQNFHQATTQPPRTFEEACREYPDHLLKPARYWDHLSYWLRFFEPERFHVIIYDDIKSRPDAVLRDVFRFLDVDPSFLPKSIGAQGSEVRKGTSPRNEFALKVHRRIYTALGRRVYLPLKRAIGVRRADGLKEFLRIRPIMESLFFRKGYPELTSATRDRLNREFADQTAGIADFLKRDLSTWR